MSSITASNSNSPFNSVLLTDSNYIVTTAYAAAATTASSAAVNFQVASPYPTTNNVIAYVNYVNTTTSTGSVAIVLQESTDNSTWTACANLTNPIASSTGSIASGNVSVGLQPGTKQYLRISAISPAATAPVGSVTMSILM